MAKTIHLRIDVRTVSGLNTREHWRVRAKRVALERKAANLAWKAAGKPKLKFPAVVTYTRHASRKLDRTNLPSAFKAVEDELCELNGLDDGDERYTPKYEQAPSGSLKQWVTIEWAGA